MENLSISAHLIHPLAIEVCKILNEHKYQAFIVGGCVRDLLLGQKPKDWDITSDASPIDILKIFPKTIPTGLQHGTVTVCMGEGVENHFEVTTFRIEGEYSDGRRPDEVFFVKNVEDDLARRDLTINAIAYDPIADRFVDPYEGVRDLRLRTIRAVGNSIARFQEDGLRIMRAARFAARFNYTMQSETFQGMAYSIDTLKKVSKERINDELCKILMSDNPTYGLYLLKECGALDVACPLLAGRQLPLLSCQDKCKGSLEVRLAFLYNKLPVPQVQQELLNLKFSNKEIKKVSFLLELVERFYILQEINTISAYKDFMAFLKNQGPDPWELTLSQFLQLAGPMEIEAQRLLDNYRHEVVLSRKEMQLNGDDLLADGMKPGVRIKITLDNCYLEILAHPEHNNKQKLLEIARNLWIPI